MFPGIECASLLAQEQAPASWSEIGAPDAWQIQHRQQVLPETNYGVLLRSTTTSCSKQPAPGNQPSCGLVLKWAWRQTSPPGELWPPTPTLDPSNRSVRLGLGWGSGSKFRFQRSAGGPTCGRPINIQCSD